MNEPCSFHNQALFNIADVERKLAEREDKQESYLNMLHDKISILTRRVEHLEQMYQMQYIEVKKMKYFSQATDPAIDWERVDMRSLEMLEQARGQVGMPITVSSNYRTPEHDKEIGCSGSDAHTENPCTAFDLPFSDWTMCKRIVKAALDVGFSRVFINSKNMHVHVDNSPLLTPDVLGVE